MIKLLRINGSAREHSSNQKLLDFLPGLGLNIVFQNDVDLAQLPLFTADQDQHPWSIEVLRWRQAVSEAEGVVICTPEYIHNIPALLKNALEWLTSSGELMHKPVLAMTFTPAPPRGEKAMQSLLWSLKALDARVIGQLTLYQNEIRFEDGTVKIDEENSELLREGLRLFGV